MAREGTGLAFFYLEHHTNIVPIPISSKDANFVFNEVTNNFQPVTIQGQFTYRIQHPRQTVALLNFNYDPQRVDGVLVPFQIEQVGDTLAAAALAGAQLKILFDRQAERLRFSVREPFVSKVSAATLVFGEIGAGEELGITSQMPQNGVIFSDGIEADYLQFNSGAIARITVAERKVHLVVCAS